MGMIPLLSVAGLELGPPDFWPMGIGAGTPSAMERVDGPPWRFVFGWTPSGRLDHVDVAWRPDAVAERVSYRWNPDGTIARVEYDRSIARPPEEGDEGPDRVRIFSYEQGRPTRVETYFPAVDEYGPETRWTWSVDHREAQTTEEARGNVLETRRLTFDGRGRLVSVETDRGGKGVVDRVLAWTWNDDDRLVGAREAISGDPAATREVVLTWEGDRLRMQSTRSDASGEGARFVYTYE